MYVANDFTDVIGQYNASTGDAIDDSLITFSGDYPIFLAIYNPVPEPSAWPLLAGGVAAVVALGRRRRRDAGQR